MQTLIGKKIEQTQKFLTDGTRVPVTVIAVTPNTVVQIKTPEKDGYSAVQLGFGARKKTTKPLKGHIAAAKLTNSPVVLREVVLTNDEQAPEVGSAVVASDVLKAGDIIKVTGTGKGKGFAGGVKRYGFKGGPRTHGQSDRERAPGSIGQTTTPGRVYKGKRMAGHMGAHTVSVTNLVVVDVDGEKVLVKGLVPGVMNALVYLEKTGESKNPVELYGKDVKEEIVSEEVPATEPAPAAAEEKVEPVQAEEKAEVAPAEAVEEVKTEEVAAAPVEEAKVEEKVEDATEVEEKKEE